MNGRMASRLRFSVALVVATWVPSAISAETVTIHRDLFGTPHIFAETAEGAVFGLGYAQAQDRLEELLKNYRKAEGTMAEVFGEEWFDHDVRQRMWRHRYFSEHDYARKPAKIRALTEAFQAGVRRFMAERPEKVPPWAPPIEPWQVSALGRYIIWGWPEGDAADDLRRGGVAFEPVQSEYRGSNQWLIAPGRTEAGAVIALIDPHLSWYGHFRFYEARLYGGELAYSGMGILGLPLATLGHGRYCSVALTTGGPDTGDVYADVVHPEDPLKYQYDGDWRRMTVVRERIGLRRTDGSVEQREIELHYTHRGPVVARRGQTAYSMALPYFDQIYHLDQIYRMNTARNLEEMKQALSMLQYMAQNIMVGTVQGDIYYLRNGRVPVRPEGFDFTRPVAGETSASEWRGLHPLQDLVQIHNPPQGYMQNNNVSPWAMMKESPLAPENYPAYIYNAGRTPPHQRAAMTLEQLDADARVSKADALRMAMSTEVYGAGAWQARLERAWTGLNVDINEDVNATVLRALIQEWDRRSDPDSTGALAYKYWKEALWETVFTDADKRADRFGDPPRATLTDEELIGALKTAAARMMAEHGSVEVPFGNVYRVGRQGGAHSWPVGGGNPGFGMATPRNIGFARQDDGTFLGQSGQTSTQVVVLTDPPESWTYLPLGESDDPTSPHFDDQARQLFGPGRMKPTYFLRKGDLLKNLESTTELEYEERRL